MRKRYGEEVVPVTGDREERAGLPRHLEEHRPPFDMGPLAVTWGECLWGLCFLVAVVGLVVGGVHLFDWVERTVPPWTREAIVRVLLVGVVAAMTLGAGALFAYSLRRLRQGDAEERVTAIGCALMSVAWVVVVVWYALVR